MKKRIWLVLAILLLTGCSPLFAGDTSVNLPKQEHLYNSGEFVYEYERAKLDFSNAPFVFTFNPKVNQEKLTNVVSCKMDDKGMLYAYQGPIPNEDYSAEQIAYEEAKLEYTKQKAYWDNNGERLLLEYDAVVNKFIADAESIITGNNGRAALYTLARTIYKGKLQLWEKLTAAGETATRPTEPRKDDEAYRQYPPPTPPPPAPKAPVEPIAPLAEYMITEVIYISRVETPERTDLEYKTVLSLKSPPSDSSQSMFFKELDINNAAAGAMLYFGGQCYLVTPGIGSDGQYTMQISYEYNLSSVYRMMLQEFAKKYGTYEEVTILEMSPHVNNDGFTMSTMITTDSSAMDTTTTEEEAEQMAESLDAGNKYTNLNVSFIGVNYEPTDAYYIYDKSAQQVQSIRIGDDVYEYASETGTPPLKPGDQHIYGGYINRANGNMINDMSIGMRLGVDAKYEGLPQMVITYTEPIRIQCAATTLRMEDSYWASLSQAGILFNPGFDVGQKVLKEDQKEYFGNKIEFKAGENVDYVQVRVDIHSLTYMFDSVTHYYSNLQTAAMIPVPKDSTDFHSAYVAVTDKEIIVNMRLLNLRGASPKWLQYRIKLADLSVIAGYSGEEVGHTYTQIDEDGVVQKDASGGEKQQDASGVGQVDLYGPHSVTIVGEGEFLISSLTNGVIHWKNGQFKQLLANPTYRTWNQNGIGKTSSWEVMAFEDTGSMYTYADIAILRWIKVELDLETGKKTQAAASSSRVASDTG